jgi:signal transduction histidine kinase
MFVLAAAEALTNAISHAEARTLYIQFSQTYECYTARYTNDGTVPKSVVIKEGGGLSSLRKKIENEGGIMTVTGSPRFVLTISFLKGKEDVKWSVS